LVEERIKKNIASKRNGVVGSTGRKAPARPKAVKTEPSAIYNLRFIESFLLTSQKY
jgi:hypothetical protein